MKVLVITQKIDINDSVLGFFHRWVEEFAKSFEKVTVICLEKGENKLPQNIKVLSLGKERGNSKFDRVLWLYQHIWDERKNYDVVFVHMNQEYVLLAWWLWKVLRKKIYMWRNHPNGTLLTDLAVFFSDKVFCTSPHSYTAKFKKTVIMPVGIDTNFFKPGPKATRKPNSVIFAGRIAPIKRVEEFVDWVIEQRNKGKNLTATIAGGAASQDLEYEKKVKDKVSQNGLSNFVKFIGPVNQKDLLALYQASELYVNLTPSGSMDKSILEAAACETKIFVENKALEFLNGKKGKDLRNFVVENHSLTRLINKLESELS
jgi:glycosyltransferase involved in cell wall biosynthesis